MKKIFNKLWGFILVLSIIITQIPMSTFAVDTERVEVSIFNLEGDGSINDKDTFWPEEPINATARLTVSGDGVEINNPWMVIKVSKLKDKATKPTFVDSQMAYLSKMIEDDNNYYMFYKMDIVSGGTDIAYSFPFKFIGGKVENGEQVKTEFIMFQGNGEDRGNPNLGDLNKPILHSFQKIYTARTQNFNYNNSEIIMWNTNGFDQTKNSHVYNFPLNPGATTTGPQGKTVYPLIGESIVVPPDTTGQVNYMQPDSIRMEFDMPPGGVLNQDAINNGWKYNPETNIATVNIAKPSLDTNM